MKEFPGDPDKWCPVQLLRHMNRSVQLVDTTLVKNFPQLYQTTCKIENIALVGLGNIIKLFLQLINC